MKSIVIKFSRVHKKRLLYRGFHSMILSYVSLPWRQFLQTRGKNQVLSTRESKPYHNLTYYHLPPFPDSSMFPASSFFISSEVGNYFFSLLLLLSMQIVQGRTTVRAASRDTNYSREINVHVTKYCSILNSGMKAIFFLQQYMMWKAIHIETFPSTV